MKTGWSVMGTGTIATEQMVGAIRSIGHKPLWVVSRSKRDAADFAKDLDIPQFSTEVGQVLQDPAVAFAYVSARLSRRPRYISAAAGARKHVLCDGPIASTSNAASAIVDLCREADVLLAVNQPFRASTIHQTMRRMIADGEVGHVQSVLLVRVGPYNRPPDRRTQDPDRSDKIFLSASVDNIDLARFLTGAEPTEVSALSADSGVEAKQLAYSIRLTNGALLQAQESFRTAELESIVLVAGEKGSLLANGTLNARPNGTLMRKVAGRSELVPLRVRDPHISTATDFVNVGRQGAPWLAGGEDSVVALRTAEAIRMSVRKRRSITIARRDE